MLKNPIGRTTLIAALSLTLGWMIGHAHEDRPATLRNQMVAELRRSREFQGECFQDMSNQFTPGYKAHDLLHRLDTGKPRIVQSQGEIFKTQTPTNLAVNGAGFFVIESGKHIRFTRDGRFSLQGGRLVNASGEAVQGYGLDERGDRGSKLGELALSLDPNTRLYQGKYSGYYANGDGRFFGTATTTDPVTGQTVTASTPLFQVALAAFDDPEALASAESTAFEETHASGHAVLGAPNEGALGAIAPGSLELSNVDFMVEGQAIGALKVYSGLLAESGSRSESDYANYAPYHVQPPQSPPPTTLGGFSSGGRPIGFYDTVR